MVFLVDRQQRAALLIFILGAGLLWATWPYFSGLLGAPVLYVIFGALHRKLAARIGASAAAIVVILIAFLVIFLPVGLVHRDPGQCLAGAPLGPPDRRHQGR